METKSTISFYLGIAFLGILTLLRFIEPEFNPAWRMISEYEIEKYGILMRITFFCWGGAFLFLLSSIWNLPDPKSGKTGKWWLLILSIAYLGQVYLRRNPLLIRFAEQQIRYMEFAVLS